MRKYTPAELDRLRALLARFEAQNRQGRHALGTRGEMLPERRFRSPFDREDEETRDVSGTGLGRALGQTRFGFRPAPASQLQPAAVIPAAAQTALANTPSAAPRFAPAASQFAASFFGVPQAAPATSRGGVSFQALGLRGHALGTPPGRFVRLVPAPDGDYYVVVVG